MARRKGKGAPAPSLPSQTPEVVEDAKVQEPDKPEPPPACYEHPPQAGTSSEMYLAGIWWELKAIRMALRPDPTPLPADHVLVKEPKPKEV